MRVICIVHNLKCTLIEQITKSTYLKREIEYVPECFFSTIKSPSYISLFLMMIIRNNLIDDAQSVPDHLPLYVSDISN